MESADNRYFTKEEIQLHNNPEDCWVTIFDKVYDLSSLVADNRGPLAQPLITAAGGSISHWFNEKTGDIKTHIDPIRNIEMPYTPYGRFIHVPPPDPEDKIEAIKLPWWKDPKYVVGKLTKKTLKIRITNMLTQQEDIIQVCQEETIDQIRQRYEKYNLNSNSYTWKALIKGQFVQLKMLLNLEDNGISDDSEELERIGLDPDFNIPNIHIYYNDDLNVA